MLSVNALKFIKVLIRKKQYLLNNSNFYKKDRYRKLMRQIEYSFSIPQKPMNLLANIRTLWRESLEEKRDSVRQQIELIERIGGMTREEFETEFEMELEEEWMDEEYFTDNQKHLERFQKQLTNPPPQNLYGSATPFDRYSASRGELVGHTRKQIQAQLQKHLYGLVSIVYEQFEGGAPTGIKVGLDMQPSLGDKGGIRCTSEGVQRDVKNVIVNRQKALYISPDVGDAVNSAIDNIQDDGTFLFEGGFSEASLPTLKYVLDRSAELRAKHGNNWYPKFSSTEIRNRTGQSEESIKEASRDLMGILAEAVFKRTKVGYRPQIFLPGCRMELARRIVYE